MKQRKTPDGPSDTLKEIIGILMESSFYFELTLEERNSLIRTILSRS